MEQLIENLTGWMPSWLQSVTEILIYFAILGAFALAPLIAWLLGVLVFGHRRTES